jgi:GMP synthase (glutamine-hydrolysing)
VDKILILDFGSQYTQLIGRRVRELGVYSEIIPGDSVPDSGALDECVGIILSGSPFSAYDPDAPVVRKEVTTLELPILGICYGIQRMTVDAGGKVERLAQREYGKKAVHLLVEGRVDPLFKEIATDFTSWMSHGDSILEPGKGWRVLARSEGGIVAALASTEGLPRWGVQFHPEVSHCEFGLKILENFVVGICVAKKSWSMKAYIEEEAAKVTKKVGNGNVLLLISGGVDSTVAGAFLLRNLPRDHVWLLYIDTGLMRKAESEEVMKNLSSLGALHLEKIDAEERFLQALAGVEDPEKKRRIIGDLFIEVQEEVVKKLGISNAFLVQGTLYTDLIESGKGVGNKAQVIKSHHNVRSPLVEKKRAAGLVIEPLDRLYKDEVRALGRILGLPESIVGRHPFPGPGLGVRILGEVTKERCDLLRDADNVFIEELRARGLYSKIWQAFCVLLPIRSVGVAGDERTYKHVVAMRAVTSEDGMTAQMYPFEGADLMGISSAITNKVPQIGRVVYDVSSKPPSTIEWE